MARRVRQRIRALMEWAIVMQYRADNPCDRLGPALGRQQVIVQHMRALPHAQVAAVQRARTMRVVKLAFEFLVLTAARRVRCGSRCQGRSKTRPKGGGTLDHPAAGRSV